MINWAYIWSGYIKYYIAMQICGLHETYSFFTGVYPNSQTDLLLSAF